MILYLLCFTLLLVGLYGILTKRDLIKITISASIMGYATNLLLILFAYRNGSIFQILRKGVETMPMLDPLPQALVLTSIVIELGTTALLVALALKLFQKYKTYDITKIRKLSG